jgi:hypothetical protein
MAACSLVAVSKINFIAALILFLRSPLFIKPVTAFISPSVKSRIVWVVVFIRVLIARFLMRKIICFTRDWQPDLMVFIMLSKVKSNLPEFVYRSSVYREKCPTWLNKRASDSSFLLLHWDSPNMLKRYSWLACSIA